MAILLSQLTEAVRRGEMVTFTVLLDKDDDMLPAEANSKKTRTLSFYSYYEDMKVAIDNLLWNSLQYIVDNDGNIDWESIYLLYSFLGKQDYFMLYPYKIKAGELNCKINGRDYNVVLISSKLDNADKCLSVLDSLIANGYVEKDIDNSTLDYEKVPLNMKIVKYMAKIKKEGGNFERVFLRDAIDSKVMSGVKKMVVNLKNKFVNILSPILQK